MNEQHDFPELGYSFIITEEREATMSFEVYSLSSGVDSVLQWEGFNDRGCNFWTLDIAEARPLLKGFIRFDGCSNWEREDTHYCSCQEAMNLGLLFREMYDIAGGVMGEELE